MKYKSLLFCLLACSLTSAAFAKGPEKKPDRKSASMQEPLQQSLSAYQAVLEMLKTQNTLQLLQVKSIKVNGSHGKVELLTNQGVCSAFPFEVRADSMGLNLKATPQSEAIALCD